MKSTFDWDKLLVKIEPASTSNRAYSLLFPRNRKLLFPRNHHPRYHLEMFIGKEYIDNIEIYVHEFLEATIMVTLNNILSKQEKELIRTSGTISLFNAGLACYPIPHLLTLLSWCTPHYNEQLHDHIRKYNLPLELLNLKIESKE